VQNKNPVFQAHILLFAQRLRNIALEAKALAELLIRLVRELI